VSWRLDENIKTFSRYQNDMFSIRARIDENNDRPSWEQTIHAGGNNLHTTFDVFKIKLKDRINNTSTDIDIDEKKTS
jgi:hypothetical protein